MKPRLSARKTQKYRLSLLDLFMARLHQGHSYLIILLRYKIISRKNPDYTHLPMIRKFFQRLFRKPVTRMAQRLSPSPHKDAVFKSLSSLLGRMYANKKNDSII